MTSAEKRAELKASSEPWPVCECHGEPERWQKRPDLRGGGRFVCRVKNLENMTAKRQRRAEAGSCIQCGGDLVTTNLCGQCAAIRREAQWLHDQQPQRQLTQYLAKLRRRARQKDSQPTGIGMVAMAAYIDQKVEPPSGR